jgi:hypothetical protein
MKKAVKKYFNPKQLEAMAIAAKNEFIVASRGFGKSEGIDAPRLIRNVFAMPRSAGALLSPTYGKLLRNTLPAVFHALDRLGYRRDIHYVVGRKPPARLNFGRPLIEPFNNDYVITWFNGSIQHLLSFDRPMSANSMNLDYVFGFEAKYLDYNKIKDEVLPANRGNINHFGNCPWHHGQLFTTDMPTTKSGRWILEKENDMDTRLIDFIRLTYRKYKASKSAHLKPKLLRELNAARRHATFFAEYDAFDNLEILGEGFIRDMERALPPLLFNTAILNRRCTKVANGYYASFNDSIHCYCSFNNSYLESLEYNVRESVKETALKDGDILFDQPLCIGMDYNAAICNLVVGQRHENREARTLKSLFVKTPRKIIDLVNEFCDYYDAIPNKEVIFFYDSTAVAHTPTGHDSFADTVIGQLTKRRWNVTPVYFGQPIKHNLKHHYFDMAFKGDPGYLFPTFNADNNEYLVLAMENTGVTIGKNGFEKDKRAEKLPDSQEQPDELKTHVTDAWDTLYIGLNFHYPTLERAMLTSHIPV